MRRLTMLACLVVLFAASAMAAESENFPKAEFFGGYQYSHLAGGLSGNGFDFNYNGNFNDHFGITADFGSSYTSQNTVKYSNYTYTFGPVFSLRRKGYTPFVHALIGGDHESASLGTASLSVNGLAVMAGGGVDFNLNRHFALRVAQADWMMVRNSRGSSDKNVRVITGLVFRY